MFLALPGSTSPMVSLAAGLALVAALVRPGIAEAATSRTLSCPSAPCHSAFSGAGAAFSVALDGHGSGFVTGYDGVLRQVNLADGTSRTVAGGLGNLRRVATDGSGTVYAADWSGRVLRIDAATGATGVLADGLGSALIAVAYHDGHVYAGTNGGVLWDLIAGQRPRKLAGNLFGITDLATAADGHVWVTTFMGTVARIDPATGALTDFGSSELYEPVAVEVGPDGAAWFVVGTAELHRVDPATGATPTVATLSGTDAFDIAFEPDGDAIVLSNSNGTSFRLWEIGDLAG